VDVEHQPTDLAVGGSNPSRRATITAAQPPYDRVADLRGAPDCDQTATTLAGTSNPGATTCDHHRRILAPIRRFRRRADHAEAALVGPLGTPWPDEGCLILTLDLRSLVCERCNVGDLHAAAKQLRPRQVVPCLAEVPRRCPALQERGPVDACLPRGARRGEGRSTRALCSTQAPRRSGALGRRRPTALQHRRSGSGHR
jgi:hypothetical protein